MTSTVKHRNRIPELEHDQLRDAAQGFEARETCGFLRFLQHGYPDPLVRWHYHEEYELHLIVETRGRAFVGDYIGQFEPGHLVLTGPRLPHNWISVDVPKEGVALRDMVVQFGHAPLEAMAQNVPETRCLMPLLERSRYGVEFFGLSEVAREVMENLHRQSGIARLASFLKFLGELAHWPDYRLLSTVKLQSSGDAKSLANISAVLNEITAHFEMQFSITEFSKKLGMSETQFSRFFKKATGNSFTVFVNRLRINKACQLLMETDRYITNVCYDVGFNNIANFNRRFLEIKGMTPKEFRKQAEDRFGVSRTP